eukprot:tig00020685_g12957.t1
MRWLLLALLALAVAAAQTNPTRDDFFAYVRAASSESWGGLAGAIAGLGARVLARAGIVDVERTELGVASLIRVKQPVAGGRSYFLGAFGTFVPLPNPPRCPGLDECSDHGLCVGEGRCACEPGWRGEACERRPSLLGRRGAPLLPGGPPLELCLVGAIAAVYAAWLAAPLLGASAFMERHFAVSALALKRRRVHTLLTAALSHDSLLHLLPNALWLLSLAPLRAPLLSDPALLALLAACAALASLASALANGALRSYYTSSLGASGAVTGLLAYLALCVGDLPGARFEVAAPAALPLAPSLPLPLPRALTALEALGVHTAVEAARALLLGPGPSDLACHLGGAAAGALAWAAASLAGAL